MNSNRMLYKILITQIRHNNYKVYIDKELRKLKSINVNLRSKSKVFLNLGIILGTLTIIDEPMIFYKDTYLIKNTIIKSKFNKKYINEYNYEDFADNSSLKICDKVLKNICYKNKDTYDNNTCTELITYIKENWIKYKYVFKFGYRLVYNYTNLNKQNIKHAIELYLDHDTKLHHIIKNVYRFNRYDLEHKLNVMEIQFNKNKLKGFNKVEFLQMDLDILTKQEIMEIIEGIADIITMKSIINVNDYLISRSWISFVLNKNEIKYDYLGFDYEQGVIGIAYFYLQLYNITHNEYYLNLTLEIISFENIDYTIGIYNNLEDIVFLLRLLYRITGNNIYREKFSNIKFSSIDINNKKNKIKALYNKTQTLIMNNSYNQPFLGINNGLSGLGLYLLDKYFVIE